MKRLWILFVGLALFSAIIGCNPAQPAQTSVDTETPVSPTPTIYMSVENMPRPMATFTLEATLTPIPSSTPSATPTLITLPTSTATVAPTATPSRVQPGIYNTGNCVSYHFTWSLRIKFCVDYVEVLEDYTMIFNVSWTSFMSPEDLIVYKRSDKGNGNMYVMDNLGNRYDQFAAGGTAAMYTKMTNGGTLTGTFTFHSAAPGAYIFFFVDDDNHVRTHGIELINPVKVYDFLVFRQSPFRLRFPLKYWQVSTDTDGKEVLTHLKFSQCTISEVYPPTPEGTLINNLKIGQVTYNIYRYYGQDVSVREYQAVAGINGIDPDSPPLLSVTIPLDNAQQCILDASEALANLQPVSPVGP